MNGWEGGRGSGAKVGGHLLKQESTEKARWVRDGAGAGTERRVAVLAAALPGRGWP